MKCRQEAQRLTREAETARLQAWEEVEQEMQKLKKQLDESNRKHETQVTRPLKIVRISF